VKIVLQVEVSIKLQSLNFEILKVIPWMPSSSWLSFLIIKVFMGGRVFDVKRTSIVASSVRVSWCGFPYLYNLLSELPYLILKLYKGYTYLKGLLKRNALRVRTFFLASHGSNLWGERGKRMETSEGGVAMVSRMKKIYQSHCHGSCESLGTVHGGDPPRYFSRFLWQLFLWSFSVVFGIRVVFKLF